MADVEVGLMAFFDDLGYTTDVTPEHLADVVAEHGGVIRIRRIGGGGDRDNDNPAVSIQSIAAETYDAPRAAHDLSQQVEDRFLEVVNGDLPGFAGGFCFEDPSKTSGPVQLPYPDPAITVVESLYRLTVRR